MLIISSNIYWEHIYKWIESLIHGNYHVIYDFHIYFIYSGNNPKGILSNLTHHYKVCKVAPNRIQAVWVQSLEYFYSMKLKRNDISSEKISKQQWQNMNV